MLTLVLLALMAGPLLLYSATPHPRFRTADLGARSIGGRTEGLSRTGLMMAVRHHEPDERPPPRPIRVPFTSRDPLAKHRAVTGINAHVRWYQRIGSLVGIVVLVVIMGVLLAGLVGLAFFGARIGLEMLVG